jgi:hypothetical protein
VTTPTGSSLDHSIGPDGLLTVSVRSGAVHLRAVDGDAVRVRDGRGRDLDGAFAIDLGPGSAALRASRGFGIAGIRSDAGSAELDIEVPRRATVVLDGESGEIDAEGLAGDQRYRTVSGDITLRGVAGRIAIESVSGDVDITAIGEASLTARVVSGDLDVRAATLTSLEVATTSGDLRVAGRLAGMGPFHVDTVSGDGLFAPVGDIRVEMTTVTGDLRSEIGGTAQGGRSRRSLVVGADGPQVSFRSMSGDLRVVRAIPVTTAATVDRPPAEPEAAPTAGPSEPDAAPEQTPASVPTAPAPTAFPRDDTERVPVALAPTAAPAATTPPRFAADEDARIAILRSLERGEIDVAEAGRRLEAVDG